MQFGDCSIMGLSDVYDLIFSFYKLVVLLKIVQVGSIVCIYLQTLPDTTDGSSMCLLNQYLSRKQKEMCISKNTKFRTSSGKSRRKVSGKRIYRV